MTDDKKILREALDFDPLAAAERLTGMSYKDDKGTEGLGLLIHLDHNQRKQALLEKAFDTHYNSSLVEQLAVFADLGFTVVLREEFVGTGWGDAPDPQEQFLVLWHPDGILASVESYNTTGRNTASIYYNFEFKDEVDWHVTSSGRLAQGVYPDRKVWVGDHDVREGLRTKVEALREAGEFLPVWIERPWLWLLSYADTKTEGYDYEAINAARISRLPEHVRAAITPEP